MKFEVVKKSSAMWSHWSGGRHGGGLLQSSGEWTARILLRVASQLSSRAMWLNSERHRAWIVEVWSCWWVMWYTSALWANWYYL